MIRLLAASFLLLSAFASFAVAQDEVEELRPMRTGEFYVNMPTPRTVAPGQWEVRFTHRFSEPINEGDVHSFWGLDSSADIGIGLLYAPVENLEVGVFRTDVLDDYEVYGKYVLFPQSSTRPLSLAGRAGFDYRSEEGLDERFSPFAQLIVSRQIGKTLELFATPTYMAGDATFEHAFNVPLGVVWGFRQNLMLIAEIIPANSDAPDDADADIGWTIGLKRAIGGHFFEILLSDTRATHVDQYVTSSPLGGIDSGDIHLGFNIERRFGGRR